MGLSALAALLALILAFLSQSPQFLARARLTGHRLDLRTRQFTGYALAALVLLAGFFAAGVPIGTPDAMTPTAVPIAQNTAVPLPNESATPTPEDATPVPTRRDTSQTPQSGAFGGPPPISETAVTPPTDETPTSAPTNAPASTATPSPEPTTLPTSTPTPSPTVTPTPTLTPTPIEGETATINTGTSTLWLHRMPGGQQLVLVSGGDIVILMPGHANQSGLLWQEVMTLNGTVGWVQERFLVTDSE